MQEYHKRIEWAEKMRASGFKVPYPRNPKVGVLSMYLGLGVGFLTGFIPGAATYLGVDSFVNYVMRTSKTLNKNAPEQQAKPAATTSSSAPTQPAQLTPQQYAQIVNMLNQAAQQANPGNAPTQPAPATTSVSGNPISAAGPTSPVNPGSAPTQPAP